MTRQITTKGKTITLGKHTQLMGILNVTPDSFSDGGAHNAVISAVAHANIMWQEGADIIDIGGESTRPGSKAVDLQEEIARVIPVFEQLVATDMVLSIDTTKAALADRALALGAHIINDVWGFQSDPDMAAVAAKHQAMSILMHNHHGTDYDEDIVDALKRFFDHSINLALKAGLDHSLIVLDPGIGFGKTPQHNVTLLTRLDEIVAWGFPVLLGTSRKSTLGLIMDLPVDQRVEGTLATTALGIKSGVDFVRVHDITANRRVIQVCDAIVRGDRSWIK